MNIIRTLNINDIWPRDQITLAVTEEFSIKCKRRYERRRVGRNQLWSFQWMILNSYNPFLKKLIPNNVGLK